MSTDDTPRTFPVDEPSQQLLGRHGSEGRLTSCSAVVSIRPTIGTVSDPVSADGSSVTDLSDRLRSSTSDVVYDVERTDCDHVMTVADVEVDDGQSSGRSDRSAAVWVVDHGDVELTDSVACAIEMTDVTARGPPSSISRPQVTTSSRPPSVLRPLSSRPDIFYTGSCLQVALLLVYARIFRQRVRVM